MKLIVAGYTAAPADAAQQASYYERLYALRAADGLGFAWSGTGTPALLAPVVAAMPAHWSLTLNDIPATWKACAANGAFGLASPDAAGREAALDMLRDVAATVRALNEQAGRQVVLALEIHCAPGFDKRTAMPDADAFRRSLDVAATLDWQGCAVMVEHCDAFSPDRPPAKGFLPLADEIRVLREMAGSPIGLSLNWGRSMIELRDPDRVLEHVQAAAASGLLLAYTFSGTAGTANAFGDGWLDSHLPFADTADVAYREPASGMTVARAAQALPYLAHCAFLAIKTNWPAARKDPLERAASVVANVDTLAALLRTDARIAGRLRLPA
jgi:hypothetical protein